MSKPSIKIITGFRDDQHYIIPLEEAHKAYFLFLNPDQRGVFSNGVALIGRNIQGIEPDYHGYMGWNNGYKLTPEDCEHLKQSGIQEKFQERMFDAKQIANMIPNKPALAQIPLKQALDEVKLLDSGQ